MPHRLFSTKPIGELHEADESSNELSRTLDARALVLLGIGDDPGLRQCVLLLLRNAR